MENSSLKLHITVYTTCSLNLGMSLYRACSPVYDNSESMLIVEWLKALTTLKLTAQKTVLLSLVLTCFLMCCRVTMLSLSLREEERALDAVRKGGLVGGAEGGGSIPASGYIRAIRQARIERQTRLGSLRRSRQALEEEYEGLIQETMGAARRV